MDKQIKQMRKEYKAEHGHFPDDYKNSINCEVCNIKSLVDFVIISCQAGAPDFEEVVNNTDHTESVKEKAKIRLKEIYKK